MNSLFTNFFKSLCQDQILLYLTSDYKFSDLRLLLYFIFYCGFVTDCQNGRLLDICGHCQRHMLFKLVNPLTKCTLLVIGQIQDGFSTLRNKSLSLVLKLCKSVQETSEEEMFIKTQQTARQIHIHQGLMLILDSNLTEAISIEI